MMMWSTKWSRASCFAWCQSHSTQYYRVLQTITSVLCDRMKINSTYSQCSHGSVSNDMLQCFRWLLAASPGPEPGGAIIEYVLFCQDPSSSILSAMFYETPCIIIILLCCDWDYMIRDTRERLSENHETSHAQHHQSYQIKLTFSHWHKLFEFPCIKAKFWMKMRSLTVHFTRQTFKYFHGNTERQHNCISSPAQLSGVAP